jgi:hypothetical protein
MAWESVGAGAADSMSMIAGGATAKSSRTEPVASVTGHPNKTKESEYGSDPGDGARLATEKRRQGGGLLSLRAKHVNPVVACLRKSEC